MELGQAKGEVVFKARSDDQRGEDRGGKEQKMQPISSQQGINDVHLMRPRSWLQDFDGIAGIRHSMRPGFILPSWLRKVLIARVSAAHGEAPSWRNSSLTPWRSLVPSSRDSP